MADSKISVEPMTCIICPMGCSMEVTIEDNGSIKKVIEVKDNLCPRGAQYAAKEITDPTRTLTTTVAVKNGACPLVPVKTASEIPKAMLFNAMEVLRRLHVDAPVSRGQVLVKDLLGTSVSVVSCADIEKI